MVSLFRAITDLELVWITGPVRILFRTGLLVYAVSKLNLMKPALKISLLLNLGLSACIIVILEKLQDKVTVAPPLAVTHSASSIVTSKPAVVARQSPTPVDWTQLESTNDYRVYVTNLRAIGCPEPTVQDIVRGDAWRGFSFQRKQLGLDGSGTGKWSRLQETQTVASLLGEQLPVDETALPAQSLENKTQPMAGTTVVESTPVATQPSRQTSEVPTGRASTQQAGYQEAAYVPSYPLVFQNVNADAMGLSDSQKAAIQQLQQQFVKDIGGPNQDPNNPAYLAKWQQAQFQSDTMLEYQVGYNPYMQYWLAQYQSSLSSQGSSPQ